MPVLVVFEGIDGSGKTTVCRRVHEALAEDHRIERTREPTGTRLGERTRDAIDDGHPVAQALLFMAQHREHVAEVRDRLDEGVHVLSDRWSDSCLAYQAATLQGHVDDPMDWLASGIGDDLRPDLVVYLDLDVETALDRVGERGPRAGFEHRELLERVRANYETLAERFGSYERVDATQPVERVVGEALEVVEDALAGRQPPG